MVPQETHGSCAGRIRRFLCVGSCEWGGGAGPPTGFETVLISETVLIADDRFTAVNRTTCGRTARALPRLGVSRLMVTVGHGRVGLHCRREDAVQ